MVLWSGVGNYTIASLYKSKNIQAKVPVHRLVSDAFIERPEGKVYIHHIDGNKRNNAVNNLRFVPAQHNALTTPKMTNRGASSNFKGVCWCRKHKVWQSFVVYDNRRYRLGTFNSEVDAAVAYNRKVRELTDDPRVVLNDV